MRDLSSTIAKGWRSTLRQQHTQQTLIWGQDEGDLEELKMLTVVIIIYKTSDEDLADRIGAKEMMVRNSQVCFLMLSNSEDRLKSCVLMLSRTED